MNMVVERSTAGQVPQNAPVLAVHVSTSCCDVPALQPAITYSTAQHSFVHTAQLPCHAACPPGPCRCATGSIHWGRSRTRRIQTSQSQTVRINLSLGLCICQLAAGCYQYGVG